MIPFFAIFTQHWLSSLSIISVSENSCKILSDTESGTESQESSETACAICMDHHLSDASTETIDWLGCDLCTSWFHVLWLNEKDVKKSKRCMKMS